MTTDTFVEWMQRELDARGWKPADLSQSSGLDAGTISNVLNGMRNPGLSFCVRIAQALNLPPEQVLRRAGLLPPTPDETPSLREVIHLFNQLSPEQQDNMIAMARALLAEQKRRSKEKRPSAAEAT